LTARLRDVTPSLMANQAKDPIALLPSIDVEAQPAPILR
jgi:hypothetical protein